MQSPAEHNNPERTVSGAEVIIAESLRPVLERLSTGDPFPESTELRKALSAMEYFIPEVLREIHSEWDHESLDVVYPLTTKKTGNQEADIFGLCLLISAQSIVPIHVRLQIDSQQNHVTWLECRLGDQETRDRVRRPSRSADSNQQQPSSIQAQPDQIDWAYRVTYGKQDR